MKCAYLTAKGKKCEAYALSGSTFCFNHSQSTQEAKREAVLKGGLAPKPRKDAIALEPIALRSTEDICTLLEDTINRVRTEPITHQKANAVGYLAGVLIKAIEVGRLEEQVKLLQGVLSKRP